MQLQSTLSSAQIQEAARLARPRYFWLRFFAYSWYATLLCVVAIVTDANSLIHNQPIRWNGTLTLLGIAAVLYGVRYTRWRNRLEKAADRYSGTTTVSLDSDGVRTRKDSGSTTFVPWSSCTKWSEGRNVFVLTSKDGTTMLPVNDSNRDSVRALLRGNIVSSGNIPAGV